MKVRSKLRSRSKGNWIWLLAAVGLIVALPLTGYAAEYLNLNQECTLTVNATDPANQEFAEDLNQADVVIDLYKVANAKKVTDYDSYQYELQKDYEALEGKIKADMTNEEWHKLGQEAAGIALEGNGTEPLVTGARAGQEITVDDNGNKLYAGLYLMVAHGARIQDYMVPVAREGEEPGIGTVAWSERYIYTFEPELISLPEILTGSQLPDGEDNSYSWKYDPTVNLKPERGERYGALELIKTLRSWEGSQKAVFVLQVEALLNGKNAYSDVVTIDMSQPGQVRRLLEKIPAGAKVTVQELYATPGYHLVSPQEQTTDIVAGGQTSLEFISEYSGGQHTGQTITNQFTYNGTQWNVQQIR